MVRPKRASPPTLVFPGLVQSPALLARVAELGADPHVAN